ncbi:hypothetical protein C8R45DRAFT_1134453 [Mycena sanguinolenta]|nr:hypothetical protein C8R45DRAFT_1134453 [Mycena sanguinolenta]
MLKRLFLAFLALTSAVSGRSLTSLSSRAYRNAISGQVTGTNYVFEAPIPGARFWPVSRHWLDDIRTLGRFGTDQRNVTLHVITLGKQNTDVGTWDMRSTVVPVLNITEIDGQGIGFDWRPSISPSTPFIITLGDERGIASGGSPSSAHTSLKLDDCHRKLKASGPFLGGAMAYAGAAAVHSIIILTSSQQASQKCTIDLDSIPIFQILSVCLYLCAPLLMCSHHVREHTGDASATVLVVCAWGLLIAVGFFCAITICPTAILPCGPFNSTMLDGSVLSTPPDPVQCATLCTKNSSVLRSLGEAQSQSSNITVSHVFGSPKHWGFFIGAFCSPCVLLATVFAIFDPHGGVDMLTGLGEMMNKPTRRRPSEVITRYMIMFTLVAVPVSLVLQIFSGEYRMGKPALVSGG